ncbi:MAG: restriction endonuclease subunit S [Chloroflexi bacterium]|nr:restriction endonuclease subunit S [Chloroflexota bacterium]
MAGEWRQILLHEVCETNPDKRDSSWPHAVIEYIDISAVGTGTLIEAPQVLTLDKAPSRAQRLVRPGDTIVSTVRPNRRSFLYLREPVPNTVVSTGFAVLRAKQDLDSKFLYYLVADQVFTDYLTAHADGSAYPAVNANVFSEAELSLPPLPEQRAIAHILGALDDKIELNRRMNRTLEGMARALFKQWFVDGVEEGWEDGSVLEFDDLLSGGTPRTSEASYWNGDIGWVSAKDVSNAGGAFLLETEKKVTQAGVDDSSTKLLPAKTTIVTARGTVGAHCMLGRAMTMNQTNYGLKAKDGVGDYFVYFMLKHLVEQLRQQSYGTIFDTITTKTFQNTTCVQPPKTIIRKFEDKVTPFMDAVLNNQKISRTLATLRDALLPKLLDIGNEMT